MASDLSKLIEDSFTLTLNGLLAKEAKIEKITKAHPYDVEDTQFLLVQSQFDFSTFKSKLSYMVPARSASLIFNTMMGSPISDLSEDIDDDSEDAIGEFISNASGGLTASINGAEFEDIGHTKFNISHKEVINGNSIENVDSTFRFLIDLEDEELVIYLTFDEFILPFIESIMSSKTTFHQERAPKIEEEEIIKEIEEKQESIEKEKAKTEEQVETEEPFMVKPSDKKLKSLIIITASSIGGILLLFFIFYFLGFFDQKPVEIKKTDNNITKEVEEVEIVKYQAIKRVNFKESQIDKDRLNNKLKNLTKFSVLSQDELDEQKEQERLRLLNLEKEKSLIEFAKRNHEEEIFIKDSIKNEVQKEISLPIKNDVEIKVDDPIINEDERIVDNDEIIENSKLHYVITDSLKYLLFKSTVQKTTTTQARISICNNDEGKTTIYIGPFENRELQNNMINLIKEENPEISINPIDITEVEFNTNCNLE